MGRGGTDSVVTAVAAATTNRCTVVDSILLPCFMIDRGPLANSDQHAQMDP